MKTMFSLAVVLSLLLLSACGTGEMGSSLFPVVNSFTPASGKAGDTVILNGYYFSEQAAGNTVKFNNTTATVIDATFSKLTVVVPAGATTGKISVTVYGRTGVSANDFIIDVAATVSIISFSPGIGVPGDEVTITGIGFSTDMGQNIIKFANNVTATVTAATATELKVTVPAGAITGAISVTVGTQPATSTAVFEIRKDIPRNGLVAFYPFNGNANDASGNGYHLTVIANGLTTLTTDRFGATGHAYSFVGGNSQISNQNAAAAQVSHPLTVAAWIKYDSLLTSSIVGKYYPDNGFTFRTHYDGRISFFLDGGILVLSNSIHLPVNTGGQWILIGVTYDGFWFNIYKNGVLVETISKPGSVTATTGNMRIGLDGYGGTTGPQAFRCMIDDVALYNRILSDAEMQQLYDQTISK